MNYFNWVGPWPFQGSQNANKPVEDPRLRAKRLRNYKTNQKRVPAGEFPQGNHNQKIPRRLVRYIELVTETNIEEFILKYQQITGTEINLLKSTEFDDFYVEAKAGDIEGTALDRNLEKAKLRALCLLLSRIDRLFLEMWLNYNCESFKKLMK